MPDADTDQQRLRRLEDLEQIGQLKARYCQLSDRGYPRAGDDPEGVAALFASDGAWGEAHGHQAIRALFEEFQRRLPFAHHLALNPSIEVEGDRASGTWHGLISAVDDTGQSSWIGGMYFDEFARTASGWCFTGLTFVSAFRTTNPPGSMDVSAGTNS
jgi:hypothetical protein